MPRGRKPNAETEMTEEPNQEAVATMEPKAQEETTFFWNVAIAKRTIVLASAKTRFVDGGHQVDENNPAKRIEVKNGMYSTDNPEEIEMLKNCPDFEGNGPDGFHIQRKLTEREQIEGIAKASGLSVDELLEKAKEQKEG